jgi:hypothetical protein
MGGWLIDDYRPAGVSQPQRSTQRRRPLGWALALTRLDDPPGVSSGSSTLLFVPV